jgi:hypothetical protein
MYSEPSDDDLLRLKHVVVQYNHNKLILTILFYFIVKSLLYIRPLYTVSKFYLGPRISSIDSKQTKFSG